MTNFFKSDAAQAICSAIFLIGVIPAFIIALCTGAVIGGNIIHRFKPDLRLTE